MSSEFLSTLFSENYITALSIVENGKNTPIRGYIFVENEMDVHFWSGMLPKAISSSYNFSTGTGDGGIDCGIRGISRFFKNFDSANKLSIFAIDADHYFFKKNVAPEYKKIIENDFILHTYCYSKESLQNSIENLNECLDKFKFFHGSDYDFSAFLIRYSKCIYEPFIRFAYTISKGAEYSEEEFYKLIIPAAQLPFDDSEEAWEKFSLEMNDVASLISIDNNNEFNEFKESTHSIGLRNSNVYLFINGHMLEVNIINPIVSEIKKTLIKNEISRVKEQGLKGETLGDKIKEIHNCFSQKCCFSTLKNQCCRFKENSLYELVSNQFIIFNT